MAINVEDLMALPDISVIDDINVEDLKREMISDFEAIYQAETGSL